MTSTGASRDAGRALRPSLLLAFAAMLFLAGCPLVSDQPLSEPAAAETDAALAGAWISLDPDSAESRRLSFLPFDEHGLVGFAPGDEAGAIDAFRAFTTEIGGERFLNVRELGGSQSGWYILRYAIEGERLVMTPVDDGLFEGRAFDGSEELREFILLNRSDPRLFGQDMVWERAGCR
jgi:hypothetical protein